MTSEQAISVLECMAIDMTGALSRIREGDSAADVIRQKLDAIDVAQSALQDKIETERNEPLTLDDIKARIGRFVWWDEKCCSGYYLVKDGYVLNDESGFTFSFDWVMQYGKVYIRKPSKT